MELCGTITSFVFVVNLACYDQLSPTSIYRNAMVDQLIFFDSLVNSGLFKGASIILLLSNISMFGTKLARAPLSTFFSDYQGESSVTTAAKYFFDRFSDVNRTDSPVYAHITDPYAASNGSYIFEAVRDTLVTRALERHDALGA